MSQLERAISFLKVGLANNVWGPGDRLPSLKKLGKEAGVSHFSMGSAVKHLAKQRLLSVVPKSGIRVPLPDGFQEKISEKNVEKWKTVRTNIANDLFKQTLDASHALPSLQELRHRYGVNYPILKKALNSLVNDGLLISYKRTYKPNLVSTSVYKTKIMVLIEIDPERLNKGAINFKENGFKLTPRGMAFLKIIEHLGHTQNFFFEVWGYSHQNNLTTYYNPVLSPCHSLLNPNIYYGICLIKISPFTPDFSRMLSHIAGLSIPVSILDESGGELIWPFPRTKNRSIRVFPIAVSDLAGQKIGQHLLLLGHREVAYFSPWFQDGWTKNRYVGICKAFSLVSDSTAVHLFADSRYPVGKIYLKTDPSYETQIEDYPSLKEIINSNNILSGEPAKNFLAELETSFRHAIQDQRMGIFMQPFFEQALANRKITAWVCADDRMAVLAMRFLHTKGVTIPREISVAGFDDVHDSTCSSGLTTYNFDIQGVTQTMIAFISNPALFPEKQGLFLEKNGYLLPRQSTGPARKEIGV